MTVLPAIDLKDGICVRLKKGDFATAHRVADDPLATAQGFERAGADWLHLVDLDGARNGGGANTQMGANRQIAAKLCGQTGLQIELGGGIRTMQDLERVFGLGVRRAVIGSAAVSDPDFVRCAVKRYGAGIAVGIDAREGFVAVSGWEKTSGKLDIAFAKEMEQLGVQTLIYTDIATDGMLSGPNLARLALLRQTVSCQIIASGGIATAADVKAVRQLGMDGVICGKSLYAGSLSLADALAVAQDEV